MSTTRPSLACLLLLACWMPLIATAEQPGFIGQLVREFEESDIEFQRSDSNVPFIPLGFLGASLYGDVEVESDSGGKLTYDVDYFSTMAALPKTIGKRDAVLGGIYLSQSQFDIKDNLIEDFNVSSVGIPLGWMRQTNPNWQLAAFFMPLGHKSDQANSDWNWQYLSGAFARYVQNENLWWAFGAYADVGDGDNFYIPYVGASWAITPQWTLSAIMPWPALIYAPNKQWMVRLGAAPSGASWSLDNNQDQINLNVDAWDFGLGTEYRLRGNLWLGAEAGVGGLRGFHFSDDTLEDPELELSRNGYFRLSIKYRPSIEGLK